MVNYTKFYSKVKSRNNLAFLMLECEKPKQLIDIQQSIDKDDLSGRGLEKYTHISVAPSIQNNIKLRELVNLTEPADSYGIEVTGISAFPRPGYEVLKFDVKSNSIYNTNRKISKVYPTQGEFKNFHPHLTIAYLKQGTAGKYISKIKPFKVKPLKFRYSYFDKLGSRRGFEWE